MTLTRLRGLAGLALASTALLTGCGAVPAFNPGVAARVDDDTISLGRVDDLTESYCSAAERQLQEGQVLPLHYVRGQVASSLALRSAADQFAAEQGVTASPEYDQAVTQAEKSLADLPEAERQALIDVQGATVYLSAVEKSAGEAILEQRGVTPKNADAAQAAGRKAFVAWLDDQDVRIDPRFGVTIDQGKPAPTDTSVSFALSDVAKQGNSDQPDSTAAAALPDSQRCG